MPTTPTPSDSTLFSQSTILEPLSGVLNKLWGRNNINAVPPNSIFLQQRPEDQKFTPPLQVPPQNNFSSLGLDVDSAANWTMDARGIQQQTFLGGSIRSFSMNGGFGDSSSNLSVELINDEFNESDKTPYGQGADEYHGGQRDFVLPPMPGSPVYFKFGEHRASVTEAYWRTFDRLYGYNTPLDSTYNLIKTHDAIDTKTNYTRYTAGPQAAPVNLGDNIFASLRVGSTYNLHAYRGMAAGTNPSRGYDHITFGGLLQSFVETKGPNGNAIFHVQVTDPREILSNVSVILNNYTGTTFGEHNILNVYGFLESPVPPEISSAMQSSFGQPNPLIRDSDNMGNVFFRGAIRNPENPGPYQVKYIPPDSYVTATVGAAFGRNFSFCRAFPMTGPGMSRRCDQGIPWYRVRDAINVLMGWVDGTHQWFYDSGWGGSINYKGYNYIVDLSGLPNIPDLYFLDFDQISLLDLCLELCDITSRDLYVSLLPVINHPACSQIYSNNTAAMNDHRAFISGIIKIDTIDRSYAPEYGAIKAFIDSLASRNIFVENQDIGYELSNNVTNKFIVGAQEVKHHFFSTNHDRDTNAARLGVSPSVEGSQWAFSSQLLQQVLPYYGLLGNRAITIPKGWGAYQQILLDTTSLDANGVGPYYVTTEMELRYASLSYKAWCEFLLEYNNTYMEKTNADIFDLEDTYEVSVPRSVFDTQALTPFTDGKPTSPCNPPYGWPLYFGRATALGLPQAGFTRLQSRIGSMIQMVTHGAGPGWYEARDSILSELNALEYDGTMSPQERTYYDQIKAAFNSNVPNVQILSDVANGLHRIQGILPKLVQKGVQNSMKVYNFLKKIADDNLGKKFLVQIPQRVNNRYSYTPLNPGGVGFTHGPFGFKPIPVRPDFNHYMYAPFWNAILTTTPMNEPLSFIKSFLWPSHQINIVEGVPIKTALPSQTGCVGALTTNFNPLTYKHEYNYSPTNLGGFFDFDLCSNIYSPSAFASITNKQKYANGIYNFLIPQDLSNFITSEGRVCAYVRFDHSASLSMENLNGSDFIQQVIEPGDQGRSLIMMPDLSSSLSNTHNDQISFNNLYVTQDGTGKPFSYSCAFVKCQVDEEFYMPPGLEERTVPMAGGDIIEQLIFSRPKKKFIPCSGWSDGPGSELVPGTGCYIDMYDQLPKHYIPNPVISGNAGIKLEYLRNTSNTMKSYIINTELDNLDTNHVYALITLPGRVIPTASTRFREVMDKQQFDIQHFLTMDVVKGLPEFNAPPYRKEPTPNNFLEQCMQHGTEAVSTAWLASRAAKRALRFGSQVAMNYSVPAPVYPDLIALPLISHDRCYGPWVSSWEDTQSFGFKDIGGKIEFEKDEHLAPWNYGGYDIMNQAGVLKASFANNLLLFAERGGFTVPEAPRASLLEALASSDPAYQTSPLITNISVDITDQSIKTTYKMDMYTPSFGKLQKQKQDSLAKLGRERQKLRDENNRLVRNGLMKDQLRFGIGNLNAAANEGNFFGLEENTSTHIIASNYDSRIPLLSSTFGLNVDGGGTTEAGTTNNDVTTSYQFTTKEVTTTDDGGTFGPPQPVRTTAASFQQGPNMNFGAAGSQIQGNRRVNDAIIGDPRHFDLANQFDSVLDRNNAMADAGESLISEIFTPYSTAAFHVSLPNVQHVERKSLRSLYTDFIGTDDDHITFFD